MLHASIWFNVSLDFNLEVGDDVPPKRRLIIRGLHGTRSRNCSYCSKVGCTAFV
jgi:hypothetical protein